MTRLRLDPREGPLFHDRREAGRRLARALADEGPDSVVVGLACGGVQVAAEVARALGLPLDALAARKVRHPWQPEYALGAAAPGGVVYLRGHDGLSDEELVAVAAAAQDEAEALELRLHAHRPPLELVGKTGLLVDDGLATGATMIAALRWARGRGTRRTVAAAPVGAPPTLERLAAEADAVVCLEAPAELFAVGQWYEEFRHVSEEEVVALLDEAAGQVRLARREGLIAGDGIELPAELALPADTVGAVVFAHGSGSSRHSPRNLQVAAALNRARLATLLLDLLSTDEAREWRNVFDVALLARRLTAAVRWLQGGEAGGLPIGLFGASTGAAAALCAAAELGEKVRAVVSRGGRPDLAEARLAQVRAPTLLIVGGEDREVLQLNRAALALLRSESELVVVPGASHLFEEPGALAQVAEHAARWFVRHLAGDGAPPSSRRREG